MAKPRTPAKKYELEESIKKRILVAIGNLPDFRCWVLKTGALYDDTGRLVSYGIVGGPDIIGVLTPADGGLALIICLEVKTHRPGSKQSEDQINFEKVIRSLNGVYAVVRGPEGALSVIDRARRGLLPSS